MPGSFGRSNGHFAERAGFANGLCSGIFLSDFEPELNGCAYVGQRFVLGGSLTPATWECRATHGKTFLGWDENHRVFHGTKLVSTGGRFKGLLHKSDRSPGNFIRP